MRRPARPRPFSFAFFSRLRVVMLPDDRLVPTRFCIRPADNRKANVGGLRADLGGRGGGEHTLALLVDFQTVKVAFEDCFEENGRNWRGRSSLHQRRRERPQGGRIASRPARLRSLLLADLSLSAAHLGRIGPPSAGPDGLTSSPLGSFERAEGGQGGGGNVDQSMGEDGGHRRRRGFAFPANTPGAFHEQSGAPSG